MRRDRDRELISLLVVGAGITIVVVLTIFSELGQSDTQWHRPVKVQAAFDQ